MVELNRTDMEQFVSFHAASGDTQEERFWAKFRRWDKLLVLLILLSLLFAVAALFILLTPLFELVLRLLGLHIEGWIAWHDWLAEGERGIAIGGALGLVALLLALAARFRARRLPQLYLEAGCPRCREYDMMRIRRFRRDRLLTALGVPVRRYACRVCTWQGPRLAGQRQVTSAPVWEAPGEQLAEETAVVREDVAGEISETSSAGEPSGVLTYSDVLREGPAYSPVDELAAAAPPIEATEPFGLESEGREELAPEPPVAAVPSSAEQEVETWAGVTEEPYQGEVELSPEPPPEIQSAMTARIPRVEPEALASTIVNATFLDSEGVETSEDDLFEEQAALLSEGIDLDEAKAADAGTAEPEPAAENESPPGQETEASDPDFEQLCLDVVLLERKSKRG